MSAENPTTPRGYHGAAPPETKDDVRDQRSKALIDGIVAEAATRAERLFCGLRAAFCGLVFVLSVARAALAGSLRAEVLAAETLMVTVGVGASVVLFRTARRRVLSERERFGSVALDAGLAFLGLLPNVLSPEASLFGSPDLGIVPVVVVTSLFRMIPAATYLAGALNGAAVAVLVALRPASAPPLEAGDVVLFALYLGGAVAVARFTVERAFDIFRRVEESVRRATAARGGLTALLQDHHDTRSTLFELRLHLDRALEVAPPGALGAPLESLERGLERLAASSTAARERAHSALRSLNDLRGAELGAALRKARAAFEARSYDLDLSFEERVSASVAFGGGEDALARVLEQLFVNAAEGVDGRRATRLRGTIAESASTVTLRLEDDGPGFPEEFFARYGEGRPFSTKSDSSGLGLLLLRYQLEAAGGRLDVEPGPGGRLELRFPKSKEGSELEASETRAPASSRARARS